VVTTRSVGPIPFGASPSEVRAWAGRSPETSPPATDYPFPQHPRAGVHIWSYRCRGFSIITGGPGNTSCYTFFGFRRGRLVTFQTGSRLLFRLRSGVHPGMTLEEVQRREPRARMTKKCLWLVVPAPAGRSLLVDMAEWGTTKGPGLIRRAFGLYASRSPAAFSPRC